MGHLDSLVLKTEGLVTLKIDVLLSDRTDRYSHLSISSNAYPVATLNTQHIAHAHRHKHTQTRMLQCTVRE